MAGTRKISIMLGCYHTKHELGTFWLKMAKTNTERQVQPNPMFGPLASAVEVFSSSCAPA